MSKYDTRNLLEQQNAALQREVAELKEKLSSTQEALNGEWFAHGECRAAKEAAEQRCAELAKDAARYRYLRQPDNCILYAKIPHYWGRPGHHAHVAYSTAHELDDAVEAAMRQSEIDAVLAASPQGGE